MSNEDLIASAAGNLADWHEASLKPLGIECHTENGLWYQTGKGPDIYVSGVTLAPARDSHGQMMAQIEEVAARYGNVSYAIIDSWAELDLSHLGFQRSALESWYIRDPGPALDDRSIEGLVIEEVRDAEGLREFEVATWDGFKSGPGPRGAGLGGQHHPDTLYESRMHYFVGYFNGRVVTSSIAHISHGIVGVFGVSTLPEYRRRGFGEAITWAATLAAPELPAHLEPSEEGASMYRKMGYYEIGHHTHWFHPKR